DLLVAAVGLSLVSVFLATLFYEMGAATAAIFELSVGAGLLSILFISSISLVKAAREARQDRTGLARRVLACLNLAVVGGVFAYALRVILVDPAAAVAVATQGSVPAVLWGPRVLDALLQAVILFGGMLGIILLFRAEGQKR
ncbi:MAG: hypothetical protein ACM3XS_06930, partial [Bacteroidota bacterium]